MAYQNESINILKINMILKGKAHTLLKAWKILKCIKEVKSTRMLLANIIIAHTFAYSLSFFLFSFLHSQTQDVQGFSVWLKKACMGDDGGLGDSICHSDSSVGFQEAENNHSCSHPFI